MPNYKKEQFNESNINYLNKDFNSLKQSLMNYAKSYFPDSYKDFNETSPGMMLLEMNAYVGDVLSFYIDKQYQEMVLPLAEERRNIVNIANMFGYKVKPIVPAYCNLTFNHDLGIAGGDSTKIDYSTGGIFDKGIQVQGNSTDIIFETIEPLDFQITGSNDKSEVADEDAAGLATSYKLSRTVKAISGKEKSLSFTIGAPEKFKKITLPDTNVIDIISCKDSNGNDWYEVDYLAQDKVAIKTHYTSDEFRQSAYHNSLDNSTETTPVPYSLQYIKTSKRFTRETNEDNTTSLVFGNGVLKNGQVVDDGYIDTQQIGITIPGQTNDLDSAINPLLGDEYSTLGETPNNTTLTITYRIGGGIKQNVGTGVLTTVLSANTLPGSAVVALSDLGVTNDSPAVGGKDEESVDEIREKAKSFFITQNRCVTKEDYEARVMNMPNQFGNIAKVYVTRSGDTSTSQDSLEFNTALAILNSQINGFVNGSYLNTSGNLMSNGIDQILSSIADSFDENGNISGETAGLITTDLTIMKEAINALVTQTDIIGNVDLTPHSLSGVNIHILAYDNNKNLVGNPMTTYDGSVSDNIPQIMLQNIKTYLQNFKILTDELNILNGYIVNFGVFFDVVAEQYANKSEVKLRCIDMIKEYFDIDKMQFNQPIYISKLEFELMGIEGVRAVNHITITQHEDTHPYGDGETLVNKTYSYTYSPDVGPDIDGDGLPDGGFTTENDGTGGYGYFYDFSEQTGALSNGIIRPPLTSTPTVFELKNPDENIKGRVR